MEPTTSTEETYLYVHKPVNIFTFTSMAMRMSVFWFGSVDNKQIDLKKKNFLTQLFFCFFVISFISCLRRRTSVMFVSISFIVLMMISLAWLVFYYIQRFRYLHAKDRLSVRLLMFTSFLYFLPFTLFLSIPARVDECCSKSSLQNPH